MTTLNFDDVPYEKRAGQPLKAYHGFFFENVYVIDPTNVWGYTGSGFENATSGHGVAYTGFAKPCTITAAPDKEVTLQSFSACAGWDSTLALTVEATDLKGGVTSADYTLGQAMKQYSPNLKGHSFTFTPGDGVGAPNALFSGSHVVFDDMTIA